MTVNIPLLRKAVEWVGEQDKLPEVQRNWYQKSWISSPEQMSYRYNVEESECGTAYCVAGYIGQLMEPRYRNAFTGWVYNEDGVDSSIPHVSEFAKNALGLTQEEAEELFDSCNDAETIRTIAERIAGEPL